MAGESEAAWREADSELFAELGKVYTPGRDEIEGVLLDLVPAERDDRFLVVDVGAGQGWLGAAVLRRFPRARLLALDGSPTMLREAGSLLAPYGDRAELRAFRLEDPAWIDGLEEPVRCVLSSLVIHYLDGPGKRALFERVRERLEPGGALLVADLVWPTGERGVRLAARMWDEEVRRQSAEAAGDERLYERFVRDRWNLYAYPDPEVDKPSSLPEQLRWLEDAGFEGVDAWWLRAGHAVYGGYKPVQDHTRAARGRGA